MRWIMLGTALLMAACGNNYKQEPDPPIPGTYTYNYTLTSPASKIPSGSNVIIVTSPMDDFCSLIQGPFTQEQNVAVGTPNNVPIAYTAYRATYFWWTIYIDMPVTTSSLSLGDNVWGNDPNRIFGQCVRPLGNTTDTTNKVWEDLGAPFGGTTVFAGPTQTF